MGELELGDQSAHRKISRRCERAKAPRGGFRGAAETWAVHDICVSGRGRGGGSHARCRCPHASPPHVPKALSGMHIAFVAAFADVMQHSDPTLLCRTCRRLFSTANTRAQHARHFGP